MTNVLEGPDTPSQSSSLSLLAGIGPDQFKPKAITSFVCLRPSELLLLLRGFCKATTVGSGSVTEFSATLLDERYCLDSENLLGRLSERNWDFMPGLILEDPVAVLSMEASIGERLPGVVGSREDEVETPMSSDLAGLHWLICAARTTLRNIYDAANGYGIGGTAVNATSIQELNALRLSLQSKKTAIQECIRDFAKLQTFQSLLETYRLQIFVLFESFRSDSSDSNPRVAGTEAPVSEEIFMKNLWRVFENQLRIELPLLESRSPRAESAPPGRVGAKAIAAADMRSRMSSQDQNTVRKSEVPPAAVNGNPLWVVLKNVFPTNTTKDL